jgi:hypothetical protein
MRQGRRDPCGKIQSNEIQSFQLIFHFSSKDQEKNHISDQVKRVTVQEHRRDDCGNGWKIDVWYRSGNETERAGDSIGNNKICVPSVEQVDNDVDAGNRIGGPRRSYDSEIRGDGKHGFSDSDFLPQRNTAQLD